MRKTLSTLTGNQRLLCGALAGMFTYLLPIPLGAKSHALLAWSLGSLTSLLLAWNLALRADAAHTRARVQSQDASSLVLFGLVLVSVFASSGAIALMLQHVKDLSTTLRLAHLALSMLALAASWLLMQTMFAFRYAHLYYRAMAHGQSHGEGLVFPGGQAPDYLDFLYYAHVVGMTSQVSDVVVTARPMRHLTLLHSITAFAFNMLVLALSINVMAGAIQPG